VLVAKRVFALGLYNEFNLGVFAIIVAITVVMLLEIKGIEWVDFVE
jgi:hypothetical protein